MRTTSAALPERAAADLAELALLTLPAHASGAMSALAHFDRALPPHMTLKVVMARHLTAQWPAPPAPSTPRSAHQGQLTAQALADILADPAAPIVTEALQLLSATARHALTEAIRRADRQVCEGGVVERVRALLAPGWPPAVCLLHDRPRRPCHLRPGLHRGPSRR